MPSDLLKTPIRKPPDISTSPMQLTMEAAHKVDAKIKQSAKNLITIL